MPAPGRPSVLLAFALLAFTMVGCNNAGQPADSDAPSTTPSEDISAQASLTDGYFKDESTGLLSFARFNEDGTYYCKFFDGGVLEAGTYTGTFS